MPASVACVKKSKKNPGPVLQIASEQRAAIIPRDCNWTPGKEEEEEAELRTLATGILRGSCLVAYFFFVVVIIYKLEQQRG